MASKGWRRHAFRALALHQPGVVIRHTTGYTGVEAISPSHTPPPSQPDHSRHTVLFPTDLGWPQGRAVYHNLASDGLFCRRMSLDGIGPSQRRLERDLDSKVVRRGPTNEWSKAAAIASPATWVDATVHLGMGFPPR
eukprot:scaffold426_cov319-Pavlova_lutheri.AAC.49